jgi:transcriptional regulator with XRE-family HTH domain
MAPPQFGRIYRRAMFESRAHELGTALRRARKARGYTLRQVADMSHGTFKASSLASYERGERAISFERFFQLTALYDISPSRLFAEVTRRVEGRASVRIDVERVKRLGGVEAGILDGFIRNVFLLRRQPVADTISLRNGDLEVLATAAGRLAREFEDAIEPVLRDH